MLSGVTQGSVLGPLITICHDCPCLMVVKLCSDHCHTTLRSNKWTISLTSFTCEGCGFRLISELDWKADTSGVRRNGQNGIHVKVCPLTSDKHRMEGTSRKTCTTVLSHCSQPSRKFQHGTYVLRGVVWASAKMETQITDVFARGNSWPKWYLFGELGKCVWGHTFPGGTHITVTPVETRLTRPAATALLRKTIITYLPYSGYYLQSLIFVKAVIVV